MYSVQYLWKEFYFLKPFSKTKFIIISLCHIPKCFHEAKKKINVATVFDRMCKQHYRLSDFSRTMIIYLIAHLVQWLATFCCRRLVTWSLAAGCTSLGWRYPCFSSLQILGPCVWRQLQAWENSEEGYQRECRWRYGQLGAAACYLIPHAVPDQVLDWIHPWGHRLLTPI